MSRIAIFTSSIYSMGGEQRVVCIMANEFAKTHDVTIYTMDSPKKTEDYYGLSSKITVEHYLPYQGDWVSFGLRALTHLIPITVYDWWPELLERAYCYDKYADEMLEMIEGKFDVVIATAWQLSILLGKARKKAGTKFYAIGWEHSSYEAYFEIRYFYLYKHKELFINNVKNLSEIIVLNEDYSEKYRKNLGLTTKVIYNPISFWRDEKAKLYNKQFIAYGRLDKCKGYDLLLEAFAIFSKDEKEWTLKIAGTGKLERGLKKKARKLGVQNRVLFVGYERDVRKLLLESSAFLLSSRFEGFPMCAIEACEAGLPVIAFDIPAMIPFKTHNVATVVECFDIEAYSKEMKKIANSYKMRYTMGQKAMEFAEQLKAKEIVKKWSI